MMSFSKCGSARSADPQWSDRAQTRIERARNFIERCPPWIAACGLTNPGFTATCRREPGFAKPQAQNGGRAAMVSGAAGAARARNDKSRQRGFDDVAGVVGEAFVAAVVVVSQPPVIQAQ